MEIKPPGTGKPTFDPSQSPGGVDPKTAKFEGKLQRTSDGSPASLPPALSAFKSRFTKTDLEDSSKLDSIFKSAARELMVDQLPQAAQLGEADKQMLADYMSQDPVIQGKLLGLLRKILD